MLIADVSKGSSKDVGSARSVGVLKTVVSGERCKPGTSDLAPTQPKLRPTTLRFLLRDRGARTVRLHVVVDVSGSNVAWGSVARVVASV